VTYFKATSPDGTDFYTGKVLYEVGKTIDVGPQARKRPPELCSPSVLHASDAPAETLVGGSWPCRLFEVRGRSVIHDGHKHGFRRLTVVRELPAHMALGPNGEQVAAYIKRCKTLTTKELDDLAAWGAAWAAVWDAVRAAARDAARDAAWDAAWGAAWTAVRAAVRAAARDAAWTAAWTAAWDAVRDAAVALVVRDLITREQFDALYGPWASAIAADTFASATRRNPN